MSVFDCPWFDDHEEVVFANDPDAGLRGIIAIHTTAPFGMSGGGCRIWPYPDDQAAVDDALRLSRAMSYKLALADLPAGGAKMVVIADPERDKDEALLRAIGRAVHRLNGRYIAGTDVGTNDDDLETMRSETPYASQKKDGGHDSALATAHGVYLALRWAARRRLEREDLEGVRVAVQGVGRVGAHLARSLHGAGAELVISDANEAAARAVGEATGARIVAPDAILDAEADVFAPCALGNVIDADVAADLKARIVCGAANNPLTDESLADALSKRGVLFVPDFVANLGGVIGSSPAAAGADDLEAFLKPVGRVVEVLDEATKRASARGIGLHAAAVELAKEKVAERRGR